MDREIQVVSEDSGRGTDLGRGTGCEFSLVFMKRRIMSLVYLLFNINSHFVVPSIFYP